MDVDPRSHRRWGLIVGLAGIAVVAVGFWLGSFFGWDVAPSSANINHGRAAARGGVAIILLGAIITFLGAVVALARYDRR